MRTTCNRHHNCKQAEQDAEKHWLERNPGQKFPGISWGFHCHNDECEECFGY